MRKFRSITSSTDANVYVGPFGELVVDNSGTIRIQDNITPGGHTVTGGGGVVSTGNVTFDDTTISTVDYQSITIASNIINLNTPAVQVYGNIAPAFAYNFSLGTSDAPFRNLFINDANIAQMHLHDDTIASYSNSIVIQAGTHRFEFIDVSTGPNPSVGYGSVMKFDNIVNSVGPTLQTWYGDTATPYDPPGQHSLDIRASGSTANSYVEFASFNWENYVGVDEFGTFIQTNWVTDPGQAWNFTTNGEMVMPPTGIISSRGSKSNIVIVDSNITISTTDLDDVTVHSSVFDRSGNLVMGGSIIPSGNVQYDLGTLDNQWRHLYVSSNTIYINRVPLTVTSNGDLTVNGNTVSGGTTISDTAPDSGNGSIWWNSVNGTAYVKYNDNWVEMSPTVLPPPVVDPTFDSIRFSDNTVMTTAVEPGLTIDADGKTVLGGNLWIGTVKDDDSVLWAPDTSEYVGIWYGGYRDLQQSGYGPNVSITVGNVSLDDNVGTYWPDGGQVNIDIFDKNWHFDADGSLTLPTNSYGDSQIYSTSGNVSLYTNHAGDATVNIRANGGTGDSSWTFGADGNLMLPNGATIHNPLGGPIIIGGVDISLVDFTAYVSPGNTGSPTIGSNYFINGGWDYIAFNNTALHDAVSALLNGSNGFIPVVWAAGSTAPTGTLLVQFIDSTTFQCVPVVDAGAGSNTPLAGTWFFPANFGGVIADGPASLSLTSNVSTWTFGADSTLRLPNEGNIAVGRTAQVGSKLDTATNSDGGLVGWGSTAAAIAYNADIMTTYPVGSSITFQNGDVRTITFYDPYAPNYIDMFWDTATASDPFFPITLKTVDYKAAVPEQLWSFGTNGTLNLPGTIAAVDGTAIESVTGVHTSGLYLNSNTAENGNSFLYATNDVYIRAANNGVNRDWVFDQTGNLTVPGRIKNGNVQLSLHENNGENAYLTTTTDDSTAIYIDTTGIQLYASDYTNISGTRLGFYTSNTRVTMDNTDSNSVGNIALVTSLNRQNYTWTFNTDGNLTLPASGTISYSPTTASDWSNPPPTTIESALDRLAAVVKALNGGTGA